MASLAVVVTALSGCAGSPRVDSAHRVDARGGPAAAPSALSAYLAGRLAQGIGDNRSAAEYFTRALTFDPDNTELLRRAFALVTAEGRLDISAPMAERLLAFDEDEPIPLVVAGLIDARAGRWPAAEKRFAAMPAHGLTAILGPLATAWARMGQGRPDDALTALAVLERTKGLAPLRAYHGALIADLADRRVAAEDDYKEALSGQLSVRAVESAGSLYQRSGRPESAKALYDGYVGDHPDTLMIDPAGLLAQGAGIRRAVPDAAAGLAEALFDVASLLRQGNATESALMFARLAAWMRPDLPLAQATIGDLLAERDRLPESNAAFAAIDKGHPAFLYGRLRTAINLDDMGQTDQALAELDAIIAARPDLIEAAVTKGDVLRRHKRFAEAAAAYDVAVRRAGQLQPHHWTLLYSRGICHERAKQWPKAEADFIEALKLKPDQPDVLNYLGYSWVDMGMRLTEGRAMLERAVDKRPKDGAIIDSLGWALYRMGAFRDAVRYLERAAELKPEDPTINDHLGDAYWQVGRVQEAMFQWNRAMDLDPEPEQIAPLEEKLRTGQVPAKPVTR